METDRVRLLLIGLFVLAALIVVVYVVIGPPGGSACQPSTAGISAPVQNQAQESVRPAPWGKVPLVDVMSGESFTISDFYGRKVVVLTFTVSCPVCTAQQREIIALNRSSGGDFVFIALDIDPNEESGTVRDHIRENNFTGRYAIAPISLTSALIREYGIGAATPAAAPTLIICPGGENQMYEGGLKSAARLKLLLSRCPDGPGS
ncbi:MAG: redoxin family protein [Methanoregulaceae archaeon]|nr:redoxin family protein [Methanoregulaceae archaeon]